MISRKNEGFGYNIYGGLIKRIICLLLLALLLVGCSESENNNSVKIEYSLLLSDAYEVLKIEDFDKLKSMFGEEGYEEKSFIGTSSYYNSSIYLDKTYFSDAMDFIDYFQVTLWLDGADVTEDLAEELKEQLESTISEVKDEGKEWENNSYLRYWVFVGSDMDLYDVVFFSDEGENSVSISRMKYTNENAYNEYLDAMLK